MAVVLLVRHGQASFGADDYDRLSPLGEEQAGVLGAALRSRVPVLRAAFTGTMRRHLQTAERCLRAMGSDMGIAPDAGFDEFDHDEVIARLDPRFSDKAALAAELARAAEPRRAFQDLFARAMLRWTSGAHDGEYSEPWPRFRQRCQAALDRVAALVCREETALVFTSGGPIAVLMSGLLHIPDDRAFELQLRLVNAGISKVLVGRRGCSFGSLNDHAHFEHAGRRLVTHG